jgi:hypothetical protein
MSARPAVTCHALPAAGSWPLAILLARARQDDLMRAAAQFRGAAEIRRLRGPRRYHLITGPVRRLAGVRPHKAAVRLAAGH